MPQAVLMERAAFSFVETLRREKRNTSRTLVVCGSGNNGGDGYAIARNTHAGGKHRRCIGSAAHRKSVRRQ